MHPQLSPTLLCATNWEPTRSDRQLTLLIGVHDARATRATAVDDRSRTTMSAEIQRPTSSRLDQAADARPREQSAPHHHHNTHHNPQSAADLRPTIRVAAAGFLGHPADYPPTGDASGTQVHGRGWRRAPHSAAVDQSTGTQL